MSAAGGPGAAPPDQRPFRIGRRALLAALIAAAPPPPLFSRSLFVRHATGRISWLDDARLATAENLDPGLANGPLLASASLERLVLAADRTLALHDPATATTRTLDLPFAARRLTLSADGITAAVADTEQIALVDLLGPRLMQRQSGFVDIADAMFTAGGEALVVADRSGLTFLPLDGGPPRRLPGPAPLSLARAAPRERIYVRRAGAVDVMGVDPPRPLHSLTAPGSAPVLPAANGATLLTADAGQLAVLRPDRRDPPLLLPAAAGLGQPALLWFDSIAAVPAGAALLLFDLDRGRPAARIPLPGEAAAGCVSGDGQTLFLPIPSRRLVLAIDVARGVISASAELLAAPDAIVAGGGSALCH